MEEPNIVFFFVFIPVILLVIYLLVKLFYDRVFFGGDARAKKIAVLIDLLGDEDDRGTVINTLVKKGTPVLKPLIEALLSGEQAIRIGAAEALGRIGDAAAVDPLLQILTEKTERPLRRQAILALGKIVDLRAVEPLLAIFRDASSELQLEAGHALEQIIPSTRDVELLLKVLDINKAPFLDEAIESAGKTLDTRFIEPLQKILERDDRRYIREKAIEALGKIGLPDIEPFNNALRDTYWQVRGKAAVLLGKIGDDRAVDALIKAFESEKRVPLREKIAEILGEIGDAQAIRPLVDAFDDEDWDLRQKAAKALEKIGLPAVEPLRKFLGNPTCHHNDMILEILSHIYAAVEKVVFGQHKRNPLNLRTTWLNPEIFELTRPLCGLKQIEIHVATCNVHKVKRFMTYAENYIGQSYLEQHVGVSIYGDPNSLEPDLRNMLKNVCRSVEVYGGDVYISAKNQC